ncbi:MAG TPA: PAS domain-containing protein, partial [Terricaulis sp.]|nr:PAS domain-containing protein [Terricaulis sp.]
MIQWTTLRARIGQLPASAWALGGFGAVLVVAAFAASPPAALFMLLAAGVWAWASQQARRFEIAESPERAGVAGLPELSPLLEALPDSALLVDAEGRIVSSNKAARRQMQFEARGQFLTSILRHPDVLEAVQATLQDGAT